MNNGTCEDRLQKLQKDFTALLIASGNRNRSNHNVYRETQLSMNRLISEGFRPKVAKLVYSKIKRSGRPMSHYSKTTGKVKQRIPTT